VQPVQVEDQLTTTVVHDQAIQLASQLDQLGSAEMTPSQAHAEHRPLPLQLDLMVGHAVVLLPWVEFLAIRRDGLGPRTAGTISEPGCDPEMCSCHGRALEPARDRTTFDHLAPAG